MQKRYQGCRGTEERSYENTTGRQSLESQGERPQEINTTNTPLTLDL